MNQSHIAYYLARFQKVLDYIEHHSDQDLRVEALSAVAAFSKFHFHRQFSALFGVSVFHYAQLSRLKRAAHQLAFRQDSILDIALDNGYEGADSFSRAFKNCVGQTPSAFRKQPQWDAWHAIYQPISTLRNQHMQASLDLSAIKVVDFPTTAIAAFEHRGDPHRIGDSIRQFIAWRKEHKLAPKHYATFNLLHNNPAEVAAEEFRLDLACAINSADEVKVDAAAGIVIKTIPGGRYAVLRHHGSDDLLAQSIQFLYGVWLPQSEENLRDFPLFVQRVKFFPDVAEAETISDIFLPIE